MSMRTEATISVAAATEVMKLIDEHVKQGGPFDNELLLEVSDALGEADRIVISDEEEDEEAQDEDAEEGTLEEPPSTAS